MTANNSGVAEYEPLACPTCGIVVGNDHGALAHAVACDERATIHRLEQALESEPSDNELREAVEDMLELGCSDSDLRVLIERVRALNQVFAQDERMSTTARLRLGLCSICRRVQLHGTSLWPSCRGGNWSPSSPLASQGF